MQEDFNKLKERMSIKILKTEKRLGRCFNGYTVNLRSPNMFTEEDILIIKDFYGSFDIKKKNILTDGLFCLEIYYEVDSSD